jgi:hypothetical protein
MEGSCESDDEPSGSIKYWKVLEWPHNWWPLKQRLAPYSSLVSFLVIHSVGQSISQLNSFIRRNGRVKICS